MQLKEWLANTFLDWSTILIYLNSCYEKNIITALYYNLCGKYSGSKICLCRFSIYLEHIPEYKQAKQELDNISYKWQEEIEIAYQDIDKLYRAYQTDKVLLTDKMRQDREDEIIQKEKDVQELQQLRFGTDGDLYKKQQELIGPFKILYIMPFKNMLNKPDSVIFDKSSDLLMLYADKPRQSEKSSITLDTTIISIIKK